MPKTGKKRGRPRKADQKVVKPRWDPEEKNEPEIGRAESLTLCILVRSSYSTGLIQYTCILEWSIVYIYGCQVKNFQKILYSLV